MRLAQTVALAAVLTLFGTAPSAFADANSAATGADEPLPYCNLNLATMVETCAPTEVELLAQTRSSRAAAATYILAYMYDSAGNTGSYYTITNTAPCDTNSDVDFSDTNVGTTWNDRISSWHGPTPTARPASTRTPPSAEQAYGAYVDRNVTSATP